MSKRASTAPAGPKPPTSLAVDLTISDNAVLQGTNLIKIASDTIIHPRARLLSNYGPVTVGHYCILSERSSLGLLSASDSQKEGVVIEDGVILEVGAIVEAKRVGEGSLIEINAKVGKGAVIGKHCKIGPLCTVDENEVIPDNTVIYGTGLRRIDKSDVEELKMKMTARQVDVLRKLIPSNLAKFQ